MSNFLDQLAAVNPKEGSSRTWIYVPYDQLSDRIGPLADRRPSECGIILIENLWKGRRRPYHKQKLALILANSRHFAIEQAKRGVAVRYLFTDGPFRTALGKCLDELGEGLVQRPAERELRADLEPLIASGTLRVVPHEGWLTSAQDFEEGAGADPPWRMDRFYQHVRKKTGLLMDDGKPAGGKYSHDADNRRPWPGEPAAPTPPTFKVDSITAEVGELVEKTFPDHPGTIDLAHLPASAADARRLWKWALKSCLEHFGPYEDAMSRASSTLFHTRISSMLNIHRVLPRDLIADVEASDIPLPSKEGFIRQVIGWREFMRHVHERTDGFRKVGSTAYPVRKDVGDAGYRKWKKPAKKTRSKSPGALDGGSAINTLAYDTPLPAAFWGTESGLDCLDLAVSTVWSEGYTHHIQRLMVLANIATLLEVDPREITDWFWVAYTDAYDWVVEPNVLAMGTFATGEVLSTKPYIAGSGYIHKMSDYCAECAFHPKKNCPLTPLYWAYLDRHREAFADNPRMKLVMRNLERRSSEKKKRDGAVRGAVLQVLGAGDRLTPGRLDQEIDAKS